MNKNRLGMAWLLLTVIMVGMSLSPMAGSTPLVSETVGSTEIVAEQNNDFSEDEDKSKDWAQEEQIIEEDVALPEERLAPVNSGGPGQTRGTSTELAEEVFSEEEVDETEGRVIDQACTGDFNLDLDGDADLQDWGLGYPSELDAAPEVLEDFQSNDDFTGEEGYFGASDSNWGVTDSSWTTWGPDSGPNRELVMAGQRNYNQYQTAYLIAGTYNLHMKDTYGDGWNGNTFKLINADGVAVDQATLSYGGAGDADITVPADGFYHTDWTVGSWQEEVYWSLERHSYNLGGGGGSSFTPDPLPFTLGATTGTTKALAAGDYKFTLMDSFGDGWNGNRLKVYDSGGSLLYNFYIDNYCSGWWNCYNAQVNVNIPANDDYLFTFTGGSYQNEISVKVEAISVSISAPSQFYMQSTPYGTGHGVMQTTTCINAGDYNQIFVSFAYHMFGTTSANSGLRLDVRATDDRDGSAGADFFNGQWETVWEKYGAGANRAGTVDPSGLLNGDWWFTENLEISGDFCNDDGCAEMLSFRFYYDGGGSTRDDYAVDNFRIQGYGQFNDRDNDGIADGIDDCDGHDNIDGTPNAEFDHSMFEITIYSDGCPADTDGDGTYDVIDWCPNTHSSFTAVVAADPSLHGCAPGIPMTSSSVLYDGRSMETLAHVESFNSNQANPLSGNIDARDGWTAIEDDGFYNWQIYSLYTAGIFEGDRSIVHAETNADWTEEAWMISPKISIPADSEFGNRMSFATMIEYFAFYGSYGYNSGEFAVYASTKSCQPAVGDPGSGNMINLMHDDNADTVPDPIFTVPYGLGFQTWEEQMFELPDWMNGEDVCFAFRNAAPTSGSMFLDLFQWYVQPTPPDSDNDGVWDARPESEDANGNPIYGADAGVDIDLCPDTPKGQAVVGMNLGVVGGQDGRPLTDQPWDVGCSAPLSLPYDQHFSALNMPSELQFGSSDGDGVQTAVENGNTWRALWNYYGPCGWDCLGIVIADDLPRIRYETKYMVMPMVEIGVDYDGVFLSWWDYVGQYYEWWNAVSYHGIQVAVADETNLNRNCEVGADTDGDLDADAAFDENGVLTNGGYEEISNQENPNSYGWFEHEVDLSSYVGKWVCVAFAFRSDYDQEWWIDDINMKGVILPPDMNDPTVVDFNPYTGADTYRADGRIVEITLADGESGIDNGQAPTTTSVGPTIDWSMSDGTSGSIAMSETTPCDMTILPYVDRECSFAGTLPAIPAPGVTMTYTVSFQDVGFKTDNGLVHPVTGLDTGCMLLADFITMSTEDANGDQPFTPDVSDAAIAAAIAAGTNVCGGPNEIVLGPYDYTLLDPMSASATSSMMNLGMSGIENDNGDVYDVHMTYFSDVNEYVLEYEGACSGDGAVRANNWLDDDDLVALGAQIDNMDITSPCGVNVAYHYNDATDTWMAATLDSTGIDYNHNGLEAAQRDWATTTHFSSAMAQWSAVYDMPSALTSVNDITNGKFGPHSFGAASTDYAVISATDAQGNYLTTADGMTLYIYWGDSDGQTCDATCQVAWPAFYGGVGMMVDPALDDDDFGTITNTEGNSQTTYMDWPLYTYSADSFPTDQNGNGVTDAGGTWYSAGAGYETGPASACVSSLDGGAPYAWSGTLCAGSYTLNMADSWGDGWNGNEFAIVNSGTGAYLWTATLGMGLSGTDTFTLADDTAVTITCGGGSWQSEVSWTFEGGGEVGGFTLSGQSSQIMTADVPAGSYMLDMQDSWGDGWNGNQWTLKDGTTTVAGPFTLPSGTSGQVYFDVDQECLGCDAGITILGGWTYEVSWTMSAAAAQEDPFDSAVDFPGRMEESAPYGVGEFGVYNFPAGDYTVLMTDTFGDGWNGNALALTDSDGNVVAQAGITEYASTGSAQFTIAEGTYNLDVGVTFPGSWDGEIGWSLVQQNYVPEGQHFTQLCVTSNGAIAFTSGDDCTSSTRITDLYGFNGIMYQTEDTGLAAGASVYLQVQNILPQKIVDFGPDNYIETGDGNQLSAWAHTVIEDTADNDGSLSLDLSRMHPDNPGLYFEVVSASEEAANSGCNYDLFFTGVTSGDQDVSFSLIPDATTNAPDDQVDYLQEGGIHQSTEGSCSLTVQLKEAGYLHHQTPLSMVVANVAEERPDYAFTGVWDTELVSAVLPGTLVPLTVQVTNNDDGVASQNGAMYDHGHSIDVCFSTNDYDECYYSAWIVDPPAPGASVDVQGQFVLDSGTELLTTSLDVHTCDTQTSPGDTDNQGACTLDAQSAASLNGLTRDGAKVTPYNYDETHSETLEQSTGDNDMAETNDRPLRISYGVANSVPSFAPSLMAIGLVGLFAAALVQGSRSDEEDEEELLIEDDAAVSPVIATILMVAITVVLSGVIYVWASQLATTSTKVTPLLTFKTEASETFWQITVTTAENPLALQAVFVQVEFIDDSCTDGYCIITQTIAEPQSYGFTPGNSDSFVTYMDMYDCTAGEGTDGCVAEFSAMDVLRINFDHPEYGTIDEGIVQLAYQAGGNTNILGEWNIDSSTPSIK